MRPASSIRRSSLPFTTATSSELGRFVVKAEVAQMERQRRIGVHRDLEQLSLRRASRQPSGSQLARDSCLFAANGRRALRSPIRACRLAREAAAILSGNKACRFCRLESLIEQRQTGIEPEDATACGAARFSIQKCMPGPRIPMKNPETTTPRANQKKLNGIGRVIRV